MTVWLSAGRAELFEQLRRLGVANRYSCTTAGAPPAKTGAGHTAGTPVTCS